MTNQPPEKPPNLSDFDLEQMRSEIAAHWLAEKQAAADRRHAATNIIMIALAGAIALLMGWILFAERHPATEDLAKPAAGCMMAPEPPHTVIYCRNPVNGETSPCLIV